MWDSSPRTQSSPTQLDFYSKFDSRHAGLGSRVEVERTVEGSPRERHDRQRLQMRTMQVRDAFVTSVTTMGLKNVVNGADRSPCCISVRNVSRQTQLTAH